MELGFHSLIRAHGLVYLLHHIVYMPRDCFLTLYMEIVPVCETGVTLPYCMQLFQKYTLGCDSTERGLCMSNDTRTAVSVYTCPRISA